MNWFAWRCTVKIINYNISFQLLSSKLGLRILLKEIYAQIPRMLAHMYDSVYTKLKTWPSYVWFTGCLTLGNRARKIAQLFYEAPWARLKLCRISFGQKFHLVCFTTFDRFIVFHCLWEKFAFLTISSGFSRKYFWKYLYVTYRIT